MKPPNIVQPESWSQSAGLPGQQLPVFFVQLGSHVSLFFDKVLKEAQLSNGAENVYVLTDSNFHLYADYNCIDVSKYMQGRRFDDLYQHHSTNKYFFEKACFDRWFIINDLITALNISYFFHADCDVLILEDLKPVWQSLVQNNYQGTMMYFEQDEKSISSGHASFWSSTLLREFCDFICTKYADEQAFAKILKDTQDGVFYDNTNVSDMILLDVFRRERQTRTLNLFTLEDEHIGFDFNINAAYNGRRYHFKMSPVYKIKQITRLPGGLYARADEPGAPQYMKFHTLHFQGYLTKALIPLYVTCGSRYERMQNNFLARRNFGIRKLKLTKNKIKGMLMNLLGR